MEKLSITGLKKATWSMNDSVPQKNESSTAFDSDYFVQTVQCIGICLIVFNKENQETFCTRGGNDLLH